MPPYSDGMPASARAGVVRRTAVPRFAVLTVAAGLALSGCGLSSSAPRADDDKSPAREKRVASQPTDPGPVPKVGECRDLEYPDISRYANGDELVRCRRPHTAYTFAVGDLPSDVVFKGVDIGNDAVQQAAAHTCRTRFARYVGGDDAALALSRLSMTYFVPDQRSFDAGASWVRCDVVALRTATALAPLPDDVQGLLDDADSLRKYGVCSVGEPGLVDSRLVMCSEDHTYRAVAALRLGRAAAPYPGEAVTKDIGLQQCAEVLAEEIDDDSGYSYAWTYPTSADWASGQRFGYCWHQTDK